MTTDIKRFAATGNVHAAHETTSDVRSGGVTASEFKNLPTRTPIDLIDAPIARINAFERLPLNWDSYGAVPVTGIATRSARLLLIALATDASLGVTAIPFFVGPLANGGVQLEWHTNTSAVEVEVDPGTGAYTYIQEFSDHSTPTQEGSFNRSEAAKTLEALLAS